jgi:glycolate oxidase
MAPFDFGLKVLIYFRKFFKFDALYSRMQSRHSDFKKLDDSDLAFFRSIIPTDSVLTDKEHLYIYSMDGTLFDSENMPECVILVETAVQISQIVGYCNEKLIPITPRGSGTSLSGGPVSKFGGVILDFSRMTKIEEISVENQRVIVEPGVICDKLNDQLKKYGYFFPPDPGSSSAASIGGMIANNAGGVQAFKYGTTKDYLLWLEVVLADGSIVEMGSKTLKSNSAYNFCGLVAGSEGTLGIITKAALRIKPLPKARKTGFYIYPKVESIAEVIRHIRVEGLMPNLQEYLDKTTARACYEYLGGEYLQYPNGYALIIEVDGSEAEVRAAFEDIHVIATSEGAIFHRISETPKDRDRVIAARKAALPALARIAPTTLIEDCTINLDKWAEAVTKMERIIDRFPNSGVKIATFGHLEGNIHPTIMFDETDPTQREVFEKIMDILYDEIVIPLGGTVTGEHGIGYVKSPYIAAEHSSLAGISKRIKNTFDPNNIMNPGKGKSFDGLDSEVKAKKKIIRALSSQNFKILNCIRCGFCIQSCPLYQSTQSQFYSPRGRMILINGLLKHEIELTQKVHESISGCSLCAQCRLKCPAGVETDEICEKARAIFLKQN